MSRKAAGGSSPASPIEPFIGGILELFAHFRTLQADPNIAVEVTLTNGASLIFNGLHADFSEADPGCVMLRGWESPPQHALIVRVRDLMTVVISPRWPEPEYVPAGFHARQG
jgi:hypothetical protein